MVMDASEVRDRYAEQLSWPDGRLLAWAASVVGVPKVAPADSFVLHAPLELLARAALLPRVGPGSRALARERLVALVDAYGRAGEGVRTPLPVDHATVEDGCAALVKAVAVADLEEVDRHADWLGTRATVEELRARLGPVVGPALGAAAHGAVLLDLMGRAPTVGPRLLRGPVRELARDPDAVIPVDGLAAGTAPLLDALLATPLLGGAPDQTILPMVRHGQSAAAVLLPDVSDDVDAARRAIGRVAAWSMVQEGPEHVPYGWTHALTIPQAVLSIGLEPRSAVAVAASQLIGMRASMGSRTLDPGVPLLPTVGLGPVELATAASGHGDAHVVKYTVAALDAAAYDPERRDLYLAAANRLHEWWWERPDDGFAAGRRG